MTDARATSPQEPATSGDEPSASGSLPASVAAGLLLAGVVAWAAWPLPPDIATAVVDSASDHLLVHWRRADIDLLIWIVSWVARGLTEDPLNLFQANVFHPAANTLAASENLLGITWLTVPTWLLSGNPILTYNVGLLGSVWLGAFGTWWLVRDWTRSTAAGLLAGSVFAVSPPHLADLVRIHWSVVGWFPVIAWLAFRTQQRATAAGLVGLCVITALQASSGIYVAFELAVFLSLLGLALLAAQARGDGTAIRPIAAMSAGCLVLVPVGLPYVRLRSSGGLADFDEALRTAADTALDLGERTTLLIDSAGAPLLALAVIALVAAPTDLRRWMWVGAGAAGFVLTGGPEVPLLPGTEIPGLFRLAMEFVPGFAGIRAPERFFILAALAAAVLGGLGAGDVIRWVGRRGRAIESVVAGLVLCLGAWSVHGHIPPEGRPLADRDLERGEDFAPYRWIRSRGEGKAVLELPVLASALDPNSLGAVSRAMVGSTVHWHPTLNGHSGYAPPSALLLRTWAARLPTIGAFTALCSYTDLRWIVVHLDRMGDRRSIWEERPERLPLQPVARFGDDLIYEVTLPCGSRTDRLRGESTGERTGQTLADVPLSPVPEADRVFIAEISRKRFYAAGFPNTVRVRIENPSDSPWPGMTSIRDGQVVARVRYTDIATGRRLPPGLASSLASDLFPGDSIHLDLDTVSPLPGKYRMEVELLQRGTDGVFRRDDSASEDATMEIETVVLKLG